MAKKKKPVKRKYQKGGAKKKQKTKTKADRLIERRLNKDPFRKAKRKKTRLA